ncbi:MAG: hypothetical protein KAS32_21185 [Candidatus Peribacteraceae bacterium]|nr:hypothetical protein [Candidatus Peribacteraceae bacterium]
MVKIIGRLKSIGFGLEESTARGTAVAAQTFYPVLDHSFNPRTNKAVNTSSRGRIEDADSAAVAEIFSEGSIEAKVLIDSFGFLLKSLMGTLVSTASTGATGNVFGHTFTVLQTSSHPSITVSVDDPNGDTLFANSMIDNMDISVEQGDYVKFAMNMIGKQGATGTVTPAFSDEVEFVPKDVTLKMAATSTGLGSATGIPVQSMSVAINANVEREQVIGDTSPSDVLNKQFSVEMEFEKIKVNDTFRDLVEAATNRAFQFQLEDSTTELSTSSTGFYPTYRITLYKAQVIEHDTSNPNDDFVTETVKVKAFFSSSDSKMIDMFLQNGSTGYNPA